MADLITGYLTGYYDFDQAKNDPKAGKTLIRGIYKGAPLYRASRLFRGPGKSVTISNLSQIVTLPDNFQFSHGNGRKVCGLMSHCNSYFLVGAIGAMRYPVVYRF